MPGLTIYKLLLAVLQAATEFLPVSSSGHLALVSNIISAPDLFFFTMLHFASLVAVILFTRSEIINLFRMNDPTSKKMWGYLIIATVPAAIFGLLFKEGIEKAFSSFLLIGVFFAVTGTILFLTKFAKPGSQIDIRKAFLIGLSQAIGILPGISRSGITISTALFLGIDREKAVKFSFLLYIPVSAGAFLLKMREFHFDISMIVYFVVCLLFSLVFLKLLLALAKRGQLWFFSIYCFMISLVSLFLYLT